MNVRLWSVFFAFWLVACGNDDPKKKEPNPAHNQSNNSQSNNSQSNHSQSNNSTEEDMPEDANVLCRDGILNGDERDTDCGGGCTPCNLGQRCLVGEDCQSAACTGGICVEPLKAVGEVCTDAAQCDSNQCESFGETQICTTSCTNTCPGSNVACFQGLCTPLTYCDDPDEDGYGFGPGCVDTPCSRCDSDATCAEGQQNVFECLCKPGFEGDGFTCNDINECATNPCDSNATCENSPGSFTCACNDGFSGDGTTCVDLNECMLGTDTCDDNATCANTTGSYSCTCKMGYLGDGTSCTDVNECASSTTNNCSANALCSNIPGSYTCACKTGFSGDGVSCVDINECASSATNNCHPDATCTNSSGSYTCACKSGFTGNGTTCIDVNECANNPCPTNSICSNSSGSFSCSCNAGYRFNATTGTCVDINECAEGTFTCSSNAICVNQPGTHVCACGLGFTGDGITCIDVNECTNGTAQCSTNAQCFNSIGNYTCSCNPGYSGNGFTCTNVNECVDGTDLCSNNATCTDTNGGYNCACNSGYQGDGFTCTRPGDTCGLPLQVAQLNTTYSGNNSLFTSDYAVTASWCPGLAFSGGTNGKDVVWRFTPTITQNYHLRVQSAYDATIAIYTDCSNQATSCVAGTDEDFSTTSNTEVLDVLLTAGTTYFIVIDAFGSGSGTYSLDVQAHACLNQTSTCVTPQTCEIDYFGFTCECPEGYETNGNTCVDLDECALGMDDCGVGICTNTVGAFECSCEAPNIFFNGTCIAAVTGDHCSDPYIVSAVPYTYTSNNSLANAFYRFTDKSQCPGAKYTPTSSGREEVFAFTPTVTGSYTINMSPAYDAVLYVVTNCEDIPNSCLVGADDATTAGPEMVTLDMTAGVTYFIMADDFGGGTGSYTLDIACTTCP